MLPGVELVGVVAQQLDVLDALLSYADSLETTTRQSAVELARTL